MKVDTAIRIQNEGKKKYITFLLHTFSTHLTTLPLPSFSFFPFWILSVFAVVSNEDWGVRTVLSRSNLCSMRWGSGLSKNGWVANSCLGKQTITTPFCLYTIYRVKRLLPLEQLYGYTNTSTLPVIELKSGLMASNSFSTILNQSKTGDCLLFITGCNITSDHLFSSLCVIYGVTLSPG